MVSSLSSSSSDRQWRTALLTLRDENFTCPPRASIPILLQHLIFSQSHSLIAAVHDLPPHEVTSDVMFLLELAGTTFGDAEDLTNTFISTFHLIHGVCQRVLLEMNSSSWDLMLNSFGKMVEYILGKTVTNKRTLTVNTAGIRAVILCLDTVRCLFDTYLRKCLSSENIQLLKFLFRIVAFSHAELSCSYYSNGKQRCTTEIAKSESSYISFWEIQTIALNMIGEVFSRVGSSLPVEIWQSILEVLRKVMDVLASKHMFVEDIVMAKFYTSLLRCLHFVLADPKGSLSAHVVGFVAALRMFLVYGLSKRLQIACPRAGDKEKELNLTTLEMSVKESASAGCGPYRPPHLRKRDSSNVLLRKAHDSLSFSDHDLSTLDLSSSDSDYSDGDGSVKDGDFSQSSKARVAAINCLQDLCQADPKSFYAQWTALLPTNDVLRPRKYEATLMVCLLFDPSLKARVASASTLVSMLDGHSSVFLQAAEYKESVKCGSFTALSSSLGQMLMQLHTGVLYLIERETHSGLLTSLFRILKILISSTPYSRMPIELLPRVIMSLQRRIDEGFAFKSDRSGLMASAISCLTVALSMSPPSLEVKEMLLKDVSTGFLEARGKRSVLLTLFQHSERLTSPTISFEALQALRAMSHNYPNIMVACWKQVSTIVYEILRLGGTETSTKSWNGYVGSSIGSIAEKVITAAIKVLDECLRSISGFKGTEDLLDDRSIETPFISDCIRIKKISSAPAYGPESTEDPEDERKACSHGHRQWCEAIEKHLPLILRHNSAMVRAAAITCFAGITSSVFFSLEKEKQDFILSAVINAAVIGEIPSVRSAACRAIGIIACFPQISQSAEILDEFAHAAELNSHEHLVSVRTTASWALANICFSLGQCMASAPSEDSSVSSQLVVLLTECALHLTEDVDKIKSNAVRALGYLSRFIHYKSVSDAHYKLVDSKVVFLPTNNSPEMLPSRCETKCTLNFLSNSHLPTALGDLYWVDRMVQAFISCVTTGNVKVQWNVCHALSNLFLNETLKLKDWEWAPSVFSILLLLLRDSSNFKIRIQAAAALAVPSSMEDYGISFSDVIHSLVLNLENISSDQISDPSNFKYVVTFEKQLTSTLLHVLGLASGTEHQPLKEFLVKKASFFEKWFKELCLSLKTGTEPLTEIYSVETQKKEMIYRAIRSLIKLYEGRNHHAIARRFEIFVDSVL